MEYVLYKSQKFETDPDHAATRILEKVWIYSKKKKDLTKTLDDIYVPKIMSLIEQF